MKKNKNSAENRPNPERRSHAEESKRNTILLILAILFFLLALGVLAKASGFDILERLGLRRAGTGTSTTGTGANQPGRPGAPGAAGARGTGGTPGGAGGTGTGGSNGGNGSGPAGTIDDQIINVKTDSGIDVEVGVKDGQLYVDPQANPNPQGGTGAEVNVNETKVIDTKSLLP